MRVARNIRAEDYPLRRALTQVRVAVGDNLRGLPAQMLRHASRDRLEVERLVGDVKQKYAAGFEAVAINIGAFDGQQVQRNRIARKRIHGDGIVVVRFAARQLRGNLNPGVAQHRLDVSSRIFKYVNHVLAMRITSGLIS